MAIAIGRQLGSLEITALLGKGGMGEVYKARDPRLNRFVAIKVLPEQVSENSELKARFEREAQTLASLSHPHICSVFDVGHQDGVDFLVMEFLDGQTLAQRLEKGPLPVDEALRIATDIADALDKAHRQGVIHRDVKPSNVMLTKSGAKLLDFGLAKWRGSAVQSASSLPTEGANLTGQGSILGTKTAGWPSEFGKCRLRFAASGSHRRGARWQAEGVENLSGHDRILDGCQNAHPRAAAGTLQHI